MEKATLSRSPSLSISSEASESAQEDPNASRESNLSLISTLSVDCLDSSKREKMSSLLSKVPSNNEIAHAISSYYGTKPKFYKDELEFREFNSQREYESQSEAVRALISPRSKTDEKTRIGKPSKHLKNQYWGSISSEIIKRFNQSQPTVNEIKLKLGIYLESLQASIQEQKSGRTRDKRLELLKTPYMRIMLKRAMARLDMDRYATQKQELSRDLIPSNSKLREVRGSFLSSLSKSSSRRNIFNNLNVSESFNSKTTAKSANRVVPKSNFAGKRMSSNMRLTTQKSTDRDLKKMAYQATAQKYLSSCKNPGLKKYKFFFSKDSSNKQATDAAGTMDNLEKRSNALSSLHTLAYQKGLMAKWQKPHNIE